MPDVAPRLAPLVRSLLGGALPFALEAWDGSRVEADPPVGARAAAVADHGPVTVLVRSPDALRRLLYAPGELGLARAHIAGELDVEGDIFDLLAVRDVLGGVTDDVRLGFRPSAVATLARRLHDLGALGRPLPPPPEEARPRGRRHSRRRDASVVRHHYDVGNDFYRLVLGEAMTYSCAYWADGVDTLEAAQAAKHELVCRKLALRPGMRVLDVGCGWGSFLLHAARHHGVRGLGITLSPEQARAAQVRVDAAGLADRIEIRVQDHRALDDTGFGAIASVGMFEHVGAHEADAYATGLAARLSPGGRLLNHAISRPDPDAPAGVADRSFIGRYVFPDAALHEVGQVVSTLQRSGLEVRDVESLREHYARTLRAWVANLQGAWDEAQMLVGPARARTWRLYMAGSAIGFEAGRTSVHQVLAVRPRAGGESGFAPTRDGLARAWAIAAQGSSG